MIHMIVILCILTTIPRIIVLEAEAVWLMIYMSAWFTMYFLFNEFKFGKDSVMSLTEDVYLKK